MIGMVRTLAVALQINKMTSQAWYSRRSVVCSSPDLQLAVYLRVPQLLQEHAGLLRRLKPKQPMATS